MKKLLLRSCDLVGNIHPMGSPLLDTQASFPFGSGFVIGRWQRSCATGIAILYHNSSMGRLAVSMDLFSHFLLFKLSNISFTISCIMVIIAIQGTWGLYFSYQQEPCFVSHNITSQTENSMNPGTHVIDIYGVQNHNVAQAFVTFLLSSNEIILEFLCAISVAWLCR